MTDYKFCDLHRSEDGRRQPQESMRVVQIQQWQKVDGKNRLFFNNLDCCLNCLKEFVDRAEGVGVKYQENWKTEVFYKAKSGKWIKQKMDMDELIQHNREQATQRQLEELQAKVR